MDIINKELLKKIGFVENEDNILIKKTKNNIIEFTKIKDYYYPLVIQIHEFDNHEPQRVHLNPIKKINELKYLLLLVTGKKY